MASLKGEPKVILQALLMSLLNEAEHGCRSYLKTKKKSKSLQIWHIYEDKFFTGKNGTTFFF